MADRRGKPRKNEVVVVKGGMRQSRRRAGTTFSRLAAELNDILDLTPDQLRELVERQISSTVAQAMAARAALLACDGDLTAMKFVAERIEAAPALGEDGFEGARGLTERLAVAFLPPMDAHKKEDGTKEDAANGA